MFPAAALVITIGTIGTVGAVTENPVSRQLHAWLRSYSAQDQEKMQAIGKIFQIYIIPFLTQSELEERSLHEPKSLTICFQASGYHIGNNELRIFQIAGQVSHLCAQQNTFKCVGRVSIVNESPENLVLEEFKQWLTRISHFPPDKFDHQFVTEIEHRLQALHEFMRIQTWRPKFVQELSALIELTTAILRFTNEKTTHFKCRNTLGRLTIQCREVLENAINFLCDAIENETLKQNLNNKTAFGLAQKSESLLSDFYGQLILSVIGTDGFVDVYHLPYAPPRINAFLRSQTPLQEKFRELSQKICSFVNFFHICNRYKTTDILCGSLFVTCLMQDNRRIANVCDAFNAFVEQFRTNIREINQAYEMQIAALKHEIRRLAKEECCSGRKIKRITSQIDTLQNHVDRMRAYGHGLVENLAKCQALLAEIKSFAIIDPQKEMQRLGETMQGLLSSVGRFITDVRGIEYKDSISDSTHFLLFHSAQAQDCSSKRAQNMLTQSHSVVLLPDRPNRIAGLTYTPIPRDGHCLYYAVSLYLDENVTDLRHRVAGLLETDEERYRPFIPLTESRTLEDYIADVRSGIEWAGDVELTMLMHVFNRPIIVIGPNNDIRNRDVINRYLDEPIFVYCDDVNHYDGAVLDSCADSREILRQLISEDQASYTVSRT